MLPTTTLVQSELLHTHMSTLRPPTQFLLPLDLRLQLTYKYEHTTSDGIYHFRYYHFMMHTHRAMCYYTSGSVLSYQLWIIPLNGNP